MIPKRRESGIDPYEVLGVAPGATSVEVRMAYVQKVRQHTPERDPEGFKRVREAYELLRSPRKRAELTLLELRAGAKEFDVDRVHELPPPPFPQRFAEHLLAIALAQVDAALDAEVSRARDSALPGGGR